MPRAVRREQNRAIFRGPNDEIAHVAADLDAHGDLSTGPVYTLICECGKTGCREPVLASLATYVSVRAAPDTCLVALGHQRPDEEVIWQTNDFAVVRPGPEDATPSLRLVGRPQS